MPIIEEIAVLNLYILLFLPLLQTLVLQMRKTGASTCWMRMWMNRASMKMEVHGIVKVGKSLEKMGTDVDGQWWVVIPKMVPLNGKKRYWILLSFLELNMEAYIYYMTVSKIICVKLFFFNIGFPCQKMMFYIDFHEPHVVNLIKYMIIRWQQGSWMCCVCFYDRINTILGGWI